MIWKNPKKYKNRFINPHIDDLKRGIWDIVLWQRGYYKEAEPRPEVPKNFAYPAKPRPFELGKPSAVWIGHSTYLVQAGGLSFLTDPVFSSHCSPFPIPALKRFSAPALEIAGLPQIDCVLLSHDHYDHLDAKSVDLLNLRFPDLVWVVPTKVKAWFEKRGIQKVIELEWGQTHRFAPDCRITAVPAQHFSGRGLFNQNKTLWCGYVVEVDSKTFYFVGDTGYNPVQFKEIGQLWKTIDLSLIPIGVYIPKRFMEPVHVSPFESVSIHLDARSRFSLGMHWNTFALSEEDPKRPPFDLYLAMQEKSLSFDSFLPLEAGIRVNW